GRGGDRGRADRAVAAAVGTVRRAAARAERTLLPGLLRRRPDRVLVVVTAVVGRLSRCRPAGERAGGVQHILRPTADRAGRGGGGVALAPAGGAGGRGRGTGDVGAGARAAVDRQWHPDHAYRAVQATSRPSRHRRGAADPLRADGYPGYRDRARHRTGPR